MWKVVRKLVLLPASHPSAQIWKLNSASFNNLLIFRLQSTCLCVPSFHDLFMFHVVQKSPPGFFPTWSGVFLAAPSARALDATTHLKKALGILRSHVLTIKKDALEIEFEPKEVTEDCSVLKMYRKDFSRRPDHYEWSGNRSPGSYTCADMMLCQVDLTSSTYAQNTSVGPWEILKTVMTLSERSYKGLWTRWTRW